MWATLFITLGVIVVVILVCGVVVKLYIKLRIKWNGCYTCLNGKTVVVTGANTGIGYITALDFAMRGARVILACRNPIKAEEARKKIVAETGNENILVKVIDMQSFDSVRQFARDINQTEMRLDILVNNAGAMFLGNHVTKDGMQVIMQTNHLSPFLLTSLLIDKLKFSAPSRIVNVSSVLAKYGRLNPENLNEYPSGRELLAEARAYNNTKLCNILCTTELAKQLNGTGVTVNCLNPGPIKSDIARTLSGFSHKIMTALQNLFYLTTEEGAQTQIYVSLSKDLEGISGALFDNCKQIKMYSVADNPALAKRIFEESEKLVKLRDMVKY